jgi:hypothetical protein
MKTAPLDPLARRLVRALYELAELDCPASSGLLARAVGIRPADVARVLLVLDARGLASADRTRLTLLGLALAVRQPALSLSRETWFVPARQHALLVRARSRSAPHRTLVG